MLWPFIMFYFQSKDILIRSSMNIFPPVLIPSFLWAHSILVSSFNFRWRNPLYVCNRFIMNFYSELTWPTNKQKAQTNLKKNISKWLWEKFSLCYPFLLAAMMIDWLIFYLFYFIIFFWVEASFLYIQSLNSCKTWKFSV